jgi:hypothetical protein
MQRDIDKQTTDYATTTRIRGLVMTWFSIKLFKWISFITKLPRGLNGWERLVYLQCRVTLSVY